MSLVLNTNASGGGGYVLSNQSLGMYPDFQNSVQLVFDKARMFVRNDTPSGGNYVASINGTKINHRCGTIVAPDYYTGINGNSAGGIGFGMTTSSNGQGTRTKRFALEQKLEQGMIIGKKAIFPLPILVREDNNYTSNLSGLSVAYTVKLLHSDGTLTDVATVTHTQNVTTTSLLNKSFGNCVTEGGMSFDMKGLYYSGNNNLFAGTELVEGQGVVAQDGDYLCVDVAFTQTYQTSYKHGILLGYKYTNEDEYRYRPIEISID